MEMDQRHKATELIFQFKPAMAVTFAEPSENDGPVVPTTLPAPAVAGAFPR